MLNLQTLKKLVVQSGDLSDPFNYFFDMMDLNLFDSMKSHRKIASISSENELFYVIRLIQDSIYRCIGINITKPIPIFFEVKDQHFNHGICTSPDLLLPLTVIYFSDIKTGLAAISNSKTDIIRFSLISQPNQKDVH